MRKIFITIALLSSFEYVGAQNTLSLQYCRKLALDNNKQLQISKVAVDIAENVHKSAKTKYLPKVDALGGYELFSKEISLLNADQKSALSGLGSNIVSQMGNGLTSRVSELLGGLVQSGILPAQTAQQLGQQLGQDLNGAAENGNTIGNKVKDALRTDTRNIWAASIMLRQPIYMGGAIIAANNIAKIGKDMAINNMDNKQQNVLYAVDNAYWLTVSLKNKEKLALQYRELLGKLNNDVHKLIKEGLATKSDGLKVEVAVNEADMNITRLQDGVALAKMSLCQLCGIDLNEGIVLEDENKIFSESTETNIATTTDTSFQARPEVRLLQNIVDISEQNIKLTRALYLPHIALTGGYMVSNPNIFNGFEKKFSGVWNVGILVQIPVWNWFDSRYRIRTSKGMTQIALLELNDVKSKISLQVAQSRFKVNEATKKLNMARKNMEAAQENLRCANLGFKEGVMSVTDVMKAQTAWVKAQTEILDSDIDVKLSQITLNKALGLFK